MKRTLATLSAALGTLALSTALIYAQVGGGYDLSWSTVDGGGATFSTGGPYTLGGTIAQPDAGTHAGGQCTLTGGFWGAGVAGGSPTPTITGTPPTATPTWAITSTPTPSPTVTPTPTNTPGSITDVIINELDSDTPGNDTAEFVELYDGGAGNTPLDGLVVVFYNGANDASYAAFDLDGHTTDAAGYFTLGNAAVVGVDLIFPDNFLQNGADAIAIYFGDASQFPNGTAVSTVNLRDALVYDTSDPDDPGLLVLLNPGDPQVDEGTTGTVSIGRCPNGAGGARNTTLYIQAAPSADFTNACPFASPTPTPTVTDTATPTETATSTGTATSTPTLTTTPTPSSGGNAFAHLQPSSPITVAVGSHFTLDLLVNSDSHSVVGQQSYLSFPHTMLQNVQLTPTSCISSSVMTGDFTTFETQLQNQVCNGPGNCTFGGNTVPPGSMAFASGALNNPPAGGEFRVARISFCAGAVGTATVRWQFSPPDPPNRHSKITDESGQEVSDPLLYQNFTINIVEAPLVGHVTWQGRPAQPNPLQRLPLTLTLRLQSGGPESVFPNLVTDASGFFTPTLGTLPQGTYNWRVKGPQHLATSGAFTWTGSGTSQVEMGLMRAGDANNDNVVDVTDFSILRATFGKSCGDTGYDPRADFSGDCIVDVTDFSLLRSNFGSGGAPPLGAVGTGSTGKVAGGKAYIELRPGTGAPPNGGKIKVGDRFTIELWVNPNGQTALVAQQSYLAFSDRLLLATGNVSHHATTFEALLQNEVCNGPGPCLFRSLKTQPGSIAFASGALNNPPANSGVPFKVGQIEMRAAAAGQAKLAWQLQPAQEAHSQTGEADPARVQASRQSAVVSAIGNRVHDPERFVDYVINIVAPTK